MLLRLQSLEFAVAEAPTRLPFRFGQTTLRSGVILTARLGVESTNGERRFGFASDLCVPKWFEKDAAKSAREDVFALLSSAREAGAAFLAEGATPATAFAHWQRAYRARVECVPFDAPDRLVRGFGVALVERALIDAACRLGQVSFSEALEEELLGWQPEELYPELRGRSLASLLRKRPLERLSVRHTIGMLDPLRERDLSEMERVDDGLPHSLEAQIAHEGLRYFKIKIRGDFEADLARLRAIGTLLLERGIPDACVTLDGNEQVEELELVSALLRELEHGEAGRLLLRGLLWLEQPLPRARSFDPAALRELRSLSEQVPVILDEADLGLEAFPRALSLGYRGISMKCCKGVFRSLLHRALCELHPGAFLAGEDLTNLPVLALQQDCAVAAALGLEHVERNGHHYFRGLDHLPPAEARDALRAHPDLYEPLGEGATLRIRSGVLSVASLQRVGFGYDLAIRFEERTPLASFTPRLL
jgi:hypothetical protein